MKSSRSAEDREVERSIQGVVTPIEDRDVDRVRTRPARIEVVVLDERTSVLSRRPEVGAVCDVGIEGDAVTAGAGSFRRCGTAVLREGASSIHRDKELGRRLS